MPTYFNNFFNIFLQRCFLWSFQYSMFLNWTVSACEIHPMKESISIFLFIWISVTISQKIVVKSQLQRQKFDFHWKNSLIICWKIKMLFKMRSYCYLLLCFDIVFHNIQKFILSVPVPFKSLIFDQIN